MKATTRGIAVLLTCVGCASTVAAQAPQDTDARVFELRQESNQAQAEARQREKAETTYRRVGPLRGQRGRGQAEASEAFSRTVRLERGGTFDLQNFSGDVTVTGGAGREAKIEAVKRVFSISDARAQSLLPQIRIEIAERGGNVEVRTMQPRGPGQVTVDYIVTLPENANVILRSATGNLRIQNISGDELNTNTLSGNVTARDLRSRVLELHSVQGNMQLQGVDAQRAILQTMAGNLEFAGRLMKTGRYQFQTHGGDIRVTPSGNPGFDLEAMTYRGDLRSDFVLRLLQQPPGGARGARLQKILRGTVGDAGAMLTMSSFSGNIVILKPEAP